MPVPLPAIELVLGEVDERTFFGRSSDSIR